ncbi:flagellar hook-basal body complex protein FliE [Aurantivibrio infirmus]
MTDRVDISRLLGEMRTLKSQAQVFQGPGSMAMRDRPVSPIGDRMQGLGTPGVGETSKAPSFGDIFESAIDKVNETQKASGALATAYELGDPNVDITDVMIASQKASVSFQAMLQVRNKLVDAYRDVLNMPI